MPRHFGRLLLLVGFLCAALGVLATALLIRGRDHPGVTYSWHDGITATVFWCGETGGPSNAGISNRRSAYDLQWAAHCRSENQYYVALPYADHLDDGELNPDNTRIPWHDPATAVSQSELKNRWVEVRRTTGQRTVTAFAQVEDVGPSQYRSATEVSDPNYVFGPVGQDIRRPVTVRPKNDFGQRAGIDLSPALARYLGISADGSGVVSWRFWNSPNAATIPKGPWRTVVTTTPANAWDNHA